MKKKKKRKTIGKITQSRGVMPPPTKVKQSKKKRKNRQKIKEKIKRGDFE